MYSVLDISYNISNDAGGLLLSDVWEMDGVGQYLIYFTYSYKLLS